MTQYELNLRDYWRIIRKRRYVIIFIVFSMTIFTFSISIIKKPKPVYEAMASVKVDKSTSVAGLFLEVISFSPGDTLATQTVIINSFPVLERVAKALGLIPEDTPAEIIRTKPEYTQIISQLQSKIRAEQEGSTNIINVTVTSDDPEDAQKTANSVVEEFRKYSIFQKNKQVIEARRFIEKQLRLVESRLKKAEETLNNFREQKNIVSISKEETNLLSRYSELEGKRDELGSMIKEIRSEIAQVSRNETLSGKSLEKFVTGEETPLILRLNNKLSDLLLEKENLLINYLPAHPRIKDLQKQITNVTREMKQELESKLKALERQNSYVSERLTELNAKVSLLPKTALQLSRLERDVKINEDLFSLLKSKYQEALIKESEKIEEVSIVKHALKPSAVQNPPKTFVNTILGLIIGIVFGLVTAFVWESLDTSIGTIEDVEAYLDLPVLGVIPYIDVNDTKAELEKLYPDLTDDVYKKYTTMISHFLPKSIASESFRALRTNIQFLKKDKGIKTLMLTSSSKGEGKTTAAINLAITIAQMGSRVLLVDGDLRNHELNRYFGLPREPGLTDVILGNVKLEDAINNITDIMLGKLRVEDLLATSGMDNISVLTSGASLPNPSEFLNSATLDDIIQKLKKNYDYVIIDAPPVLPVSDAVILSRKVDGALIVYQVGRIARSALKRSKLILDNVNAQMLGTVLSGLKAEVSPDFYHMSYYYYSREKEDTSAHPSKKRSLFGKKSRKYIDNITL